MPCRYAVQWVTNNPTRRTPRWSLWHATEDGARTLCGETVTHGPEKCRYEPRSQEGTGVVECRTCLYRLDGARTEVVGVAWREIPLTRGMVAIVDAADHAELSRHRWHYNPGGHSGYAVRAEYADGVQYKVQMHRQITGAKDGELVDHINRNGLDNRRANLRVCANTQNLWNRASYIGRSKYKGVSWRANRGHWKVSIQVNKKRIYLGSFTSEIEAACAYDAAAVEHYGVFAYLNFPRQQNAA